MKIDKKKLEKWLKVAGKLCNKKTSLLATTMLRFSGNEIHATDLETFAIFRHEGKTDIDFCVPWHDLDRIIKVTKTPEIEIKAEVKFYPSGGEAPSFQGAEVKIGKYTLNCDFNPGDYPTKPKLIPDAGWKSLPLKNLEKLITIGGSNSLKLWENSLFFDFRHEFIYSTDGGRLYCSKTLPKEDQDILPVPKNFAKLFLSWKGQEYQWVVNQTSQSEGVIEWLWISCENGMFMTRLPEGIAPNAYDLLESARKSAVVHFQTDRKKMITSVEEALVVLEGDYLEIEIKVSESGVSLHAENPEKGKYDDMNFPADFQDDVVKETSVFIPAWQLRDALKLFSEDQIQISMQEEKCLRVMLIDGIPKQSRGFMVDKPSDFWVGIMPMRED